MSRKLGWFLATCAVVFLSAGSALAGPIQIAGPVTVSLKAVGSSGSETSTVGVDIDESDGSFEGSGESTSTLWDADWRIEGNADPVVFAFLSIRNTSATTQTYTFNVTVPVAPAITGPTKTSGIVEATLVSDGTAATLSSSGANPIYQASIDGVPFMSLLNAPFSLGAGAFGAANTSASFGLPGQTMVGPPALATISIDYVFRLTRGDSVTLNGNFVVIPEPASCVLAGLGVLGLALLARRRR